MEFSTECAQIFRSESEHGRLEMATRGPSPGLRGLVRSYCLYDEARVLHSTHQHLPHPDVTFIVSLGGTLEVRDPAGGRQRFGEGQGFLAGLHTAPALTDSGPRQRGVEVRLTPLGAHRLLGGMPMHQVSNQTLALDDVLGPAGFELSARLVESRGWREPFAVLDAFFARRIRAGPRLPAAVVEAWRLLEASDGRVRISEVAARVGWSRKRLGNAFRERIGPAPKTFARVLRFDRAMGLLKQRADVRWSDVALVCGYHDQAHLTREVREFSGSTPGQIARCLVPESGAMMAG